MNLNATIAARLWAKVDKSGGPDACWPFMGSRNDEDYGQISNSPGKPELAHRVAWVLAHGEIPAETPRVLHKCDNPPCCNTAHHFLGTQKDNVADMLAKGRETRHPFALHPERHNSRLYPELRRGENNGCSKLAEADVRAIRAAYASDGGPAYGKVARVAKLFPAIKKVTVQAITSGRLWKHVDCEVTA